MNLRKVLILDDLVSLAKNITMRLRQDFGPRLPIACFNEERRFKSKLDKCKDDDTLILINASFKPFPKARRSEFAGLQRIIKRGLRINWLKRNPVIAYGTVSQSDLLFLRIGRIFEADASHTYLDMHEIERVNIRTLVDSMEPIADGLALRDAINATCVYQLAEFISSVEHQPLSKLDKLNSARGRRDFSRSLTHLRQILLDECPVDRLRLQQTIKDLDDYDPLIKRAIQKNVECIRVELMSVVNSLRR
jgi:hypothetical protein